MNYCSALPSLGSRSHVTAYDIIDSTIGNAFCDVSDWCRRSARNDRRQVDDVRFSFLAHLSNMGYWLRGIIVCCVLANHGTRVDGWSVGTSHEPHFTGCYSICTEIIEVE